MGLIAVVMALPAELDVRASRALLVAAVHPALHSDEPQPAGLVLAKLDEGGPHEIDRLSVPELHLDDPPAAQHGARRVRSPHQQSNSLSCSNITGPRAWPSSRWPDAQGGSAGTDTT